MPLSQSTFRAALLDASQPVPEGLIDASAAPAGKRFSVYRNNVAVSLTEALQAGFPILRKLLGAENFDRLAGLFLRAHPPSSPLMMHYGTEMPAFLQGFEPLKHLGYLPDVARLEIAMRASYHAADATPLDPTALGRLPPERLMQSRLHLAPAVRLLTSDWPLFDLWAFNTQDGAPKPRAIAQDVLIVRPEFDPAPHALTKAQGAWITAIGADRTLAEAQDQAARIDPDFDLTPLLSLLISSGALTALPEKIPQEGRPT